MFSIEVKIEPGTFIVNVENFAAAGKCHRQIINGFRSPKGGPHYFFNVLQTNDFKLEISAKVR